MIVEQYNWKVIQILVNKPAHIKKEEMEQLIDIVIFMSFCETTSIKTLLESIHIATSSKWCNNMQEMGILHLNDNTKFIPAGKGGHDKVFKVRPMIDRIP
ncbi:hypothetical protein HHI36_004912 [Cryptolaemus montrouzieri]|uniref:Uncharacterized protein n=1 Tax=Cryptolaemus montrouzieri TaxID=559131 RepID=A0ABD2NSL5_9CUCU